MSKITEHQAAQSLRDNQMKYGFLGLPGERARTNDNFLPTPRHLLGGVAHTASLTAYHLAQALEGKKVMRSIHRRMISRGGR